MDSTHFSIIALVIVSVGVAIAYRMLFAPKKLERGEKPKGSHELEVAMKMGSPDEKCEAMREMAQLYSRHNDVWTAESYIKLALKVMEEAYGTRGPELTEVLRDYASLMRKFGRGGQAVELEERMKKLNKTAHS
ncbi:MAG: hypothetical protein K2W95_10395 [Candidatus Obscuribacterales bacterium]|nr:hypothetical protein [Candidatus Obscuribacterales bacterium]